MKQRESTAGATRSLSEQAVFLAAEFWLGVRESLALAASAMPWGFAFGVLAQPVFNAFQTFLMSAYVFSGTAQFVALDQWSATMTITPLLLTVFAVNSRYLLQGMTLAPWMAPVPFLPRVATLFFLTDMSWAISLKRLRAGEVGVGFLLGVSVTTYLGWVLGTMIGFYVPLPMGSSHTIGLDFAVSAALIGMAGATWSGVATVLPWMVAAIVASIVYYLVPGNAYMIAGGLAGAFAGAWRDTN